MPAPACIAQAAEDYRFNSNFLLNSVKDLGPEEWFKRPSECSNHIAWIVGHVIWTRKAVLARLGSDWSAPWLGLFARGAKLDETVAYPSPDTLIDAWRETGDLLHGVLENCPEDVLAKPAAPPSPPTVDGKISGLVRFLAWHETYHVGQIAYVRCLLGHKSLMG